MIEQIYLPLLVALTSAAVVAAGARWLRLPRSAIAGALRRAAEWAGLTVMLLAANLAAGFALVLALRRATGAFVSLYLNADLTLLALSALQAAALLGWMEAAERG